MSTPSTDTPVAERPKHSVAALTAGWIGVVGHLATAVWYLASGLVAPGWAVVALLVIWLALLGLAVHLLRRRPVWALAVPVLAAAVWFAAISAGEAWLGWTA